jgi:hypothetical protein
MGENEKSRNGETEIIRNKKFEMQALAAGLETLNLKLETKKISSWEWIE